MADFVVEIGDIRLDRYIRKFIVPIKQAMLQRSLRLKRIRLNNLTVLSSQRVQVGDVIFIAEELLADRIKQTENKRVKNFLSSLVLYESDRFLIINKPYGLAVQGGKNVATSISELVDSGVYIVHRLDQHTTGAMILAKDLETTKILGDKFKNREIIKKYFALTAGIPAEDSGEIASYIIKKRFRDKEFMVSTQNNQEGQYAFTRFKVMEKFTKFSIAYLELMPETGRKHQLRIHMKDIGCPIVSDGKYGGKSVFTTGLDRKLNLHAAYIEFELYGEQIKISAPLPRHMEYNLQILNSARI